MNIMKVEQVRDNVIGMRPVYHEGGNATEVFLDSGEMVLDKRATASVVRALARCYAIDLVAQRKLLKNSLNRKAVFPFYLDEKRVFVPLKMRTGVTASDSIYGYVDVLYMDEVKVVEQKICEVTLVNGMELAVFSSRNTVIQNEHVGREVLALLQDGQDDDNSDEVRIVESVRSLVRTLGNMARQLERIERRM